MYTLEFNNKSMNELIKLFEQLYNVYGDKYKIELCSEGKIEICLPEEDDKENEKEGSEIFKPAERSNNTMVFNK